MRACVHCDYIISEDMAEQLTNASVCPRCGKEPGWIPKNWRGRSMNELVIPVRNGIITRVIVKRGDEFSIVGLSAKDVELIQSMLYDASTDSK